MRLLKFIRDVIEESDASDIIRFIVLVLATIGLSWYMGTDYLILAIATMTVSFAILYFVYRD